MHRLETMLNSTAVGPGLRRAEVESELDWMQASATQAGRGGTLFTNSSDAPLLDPLPTPPPWGEEGEIPSPKFLAAREQIEGLQCKERREIRVFALSAFFAVKPPCGFAALCSLRLKPLAAAPAAPR